VQESQIHLQLSLLAQNLQSSLQVQKKPADR